MFFFPQKKNKRVIYEIIIQKNISFLIGCVIHPYFYRTLDEN